jgi:hypothetical protein
MTRVWRAVRIALVVGMIGVTAYSGIAEGIPTARNTASTFQSAAAVLQLVYGGLSIAVLVAMAFRPRAVSALLLAWGVALTAVGTVAPVAWGGQSWAVGAAGGLAVAAIAALVIAAWRAHARSAGSPTGR